MFLIGIPMRNILCPTIRYFIGNRE
jgi:hypothetical protein